MNSLIVQAYEQAEKVFQELNLARFRQTPYGGFTTWEDINLWNKLIDVLFSHSDAAPTVDQLKYFIHEFWMMFQQDPALRTLPIPLVQSIKIVFLPFKECLGELSSSSFLANCREDGSLGPLSLDYTWSPNSDLLVLDQKDGTHTTFISIV